MRVILPKNISSGANIRCYSGSALPWFFTHAINRNSQFPCYNVSELFNIYFKTSIVLFKPNIQFFFDNKNCRIPRNLS